MTIASSSDSSLTNLSTNATHVCGFCREIVEMSVALKFTVRKV
jgi:hypothetical protein